MKLEASIRMYQNCKKTSVKEIDGDAQIMSWLYMGKAWQVVHLREMYVQCFSL